MELKQYEIKGSYQETDYYKPYNKVVSAPNERQAEEKIYTLIGSKHKLKREYIKIESVTEIKGE